MKKLFNFFFIVFFLGFNTSISSQSNIVYIDMEKIMSKSKAGISIRKQLEKMHKSNIDEFTKTEKNLKEEEKKLLSKKNILNKEEFEKQISSLRKKAVEYRETRKKKIDDLTKKRLEATAKLLDTINPILAQYSKDNSISIIIQKKNIIIGKSELDITSEILKTVDKSISKISLK